jgi:predicted nucleotidyltransferase
MITQSDELLLQVLAERLDAEPDLRVATVFGSVASGSAGFDSDVDVAVMLERRMDTARRTSLIGLVAEVMGRPVDLVDLRDAGVAVMRAALCEGRVLVCRDRRDYEFLLSKMVTDAEDFLPGLQRMQAERRKAWMG